MTENAPFLGYITRYALTAGILPRTLQVTSTSADMVKVVRESLVSEYYHGEGKDWHRTLESAQARARLMRAAKVASLKKSISKLEMMDFSAVAGDKP